MTLAPIALFVYKRPEHTRKTLEALSMCPEFQDSPLHVFCDGAKGSKDQVLVSQTRDVITHLVAGNATVFHAPENQGLANSIIKGVTQLVERYGRVIVLEDDLVVTPSFLKYMNDALETYQDSPEVMQVSGYMFPVKEFNNSNEAIFLPFITSWGWGTWQRSWKHFSENAEGFELLSKDKALRKKFNLDGYYDYFNMLKLHQLGHLSSWAVLWYLSVFIQKGLVIYPPVSYVKNIGSEGSGTHSSRLSSMLFSILNSKQITLSRKSVHFPRELSVRREYFKAVKRGIILHSLRNRAGILKRYFINHAFIKSIVKNPRSRET